MKDLNKYIWKDKAVRTATEFIQKEYKMVDMTEKNLQLAYNQLLTIRDMLAAAETNTVSMKFSPKLLSTGDETDNQSEAVVPESSTIRDTFTDDELMKRLIGKKE